MSVQARHDSVNSDTRIHSDSSRYEGAMTNEERSDIYSCSTKKPDHRLNKILDLNSFLKVFGIYKSVMTEVYQQRQKELDLYERNIIDME